MTADVGITQYDGIGPVGNCVLISRARRGCRRRDACGQNLSTGESVTNGAVIAADAIYIGANGCALGERAKGVHVGRGSPLVGIWHVHICVIGGSRYLDFVSRFGGSGSFKLLGWKSSL